MRKCAIRTSSICHVYLHMAIQRRHCENMTTTKDIDGVFVQLICIFFVRLELEMINNSCENTFLRSTNDTIFDVWALFPTNGRALVPATEFLITLLKGEGGREHFP